MLVASWLQVYPLLSGLEGSLWLGGFRCALCFLAFRVECSQDPIRRSSAQKTALLPQTTSLAPCGWAGHWLVWVAAFRGQAGTGWVRASKFFWRSEVLLARLLFATNPHTIPETTQNTSRFLTHPQQRPRMPQKEVLEESSFEGFLRSPRVNFLRFPFMVAFWAFSEHGILIL